jgi:glycosyltransferase involved in cell wall biosynthesis
MPRLSIITICFNNLQDVIKTCESVDMQEVKPFEHLIIDGSSKPDIKEYLVSHPQPAYRRAIHERDKGIADAFNKGVFNAIGDVTILLNSGDTLYDATVVSRVMKEFEQDPSLMWLHGKLHMRRGGIWVTVGKPFEQAKLYRGMRGVFHPTMYVRKEVYDRRGMFDESIKMAMDYDFLCRIGAEKNKFIDYPLSTFDPTGVSTTKYLDAMKESYAAYRSHHGHTFKQTLWGWRLTVLHHLLESPLGKVLYWLKVKLGLANT